MTSAVQLQVLLHTYCREDPYPEDNPAVVDAKIWLTTNKLAEYVGGDTGDGAMRLTDRGNAYVKSLFMTPLPMHCWVTHGTILYHSAD